MRQIQITKRAGSESRCHRTRATPTSLAPSSWPAVPAGPSVSRCTHKRQPDQGDPPQCHPSHAWLVPARFTGFPAQRLVPIVEPARE